MHRNLAILIGFVSFLFVGLTGLLAWMLIPRQRDNIPEQQGISNNSPTVNLLGGPEFHAGVNVQLGLPNLAQNSVNVQDGNGTTEPPEIDLYEDADSALFRPQRAARGSRWKRKQKRIARKRKRRQWRRKIQRMMASQTTERPKCKRCRLTNETTEDPAELVTFIASINSAEDLDYWALDEANSTVLEDHNFPVSEDNSTKSERNPIVPTAAQATEELTEMYFSTTGQPVMHTSQENQHAEYE